jgi:hypothetical protein
MPKRSRPPTRDEVQPKEKIRLTSEQRADLAELLNISDQARIAQMGSAVEAALNDHWFIEWGEDSHKPVHARDALTPVVNAARKLRQALEDIDVWTGSELDGELGKEPLVDRPVHIMKGRGRIYGRGKVTLTASLLRAALALLEKVCEELLTDYQREPSHRGTTPQTARNRHTIPALARIFDELWEARDVEDVDWSEDTDAERLKLERHERLDCKERFVAMSLEFAGIPGLATSDVWGGGPEQTRLGRLLEGLEKQAGR